MRGSPRVGIHAYVFGAPATAGGWQSIARAASEAGFALLEVPLLDARNVAVVEILRAAREHGLDVTCSAGLTIGSDLSSPDSEVVARGEAVLERAVDTAATLGAKILTGVLYSALERYTSPPTEVGRRNCIESLRRVARRAETAGLTLGIEAVNRYETNLVNTANQAADLIVEIGAPNVVVHLDAYHMNIEEASFASAISTAQSRLGYVHIAESNRGRLGAGTIDFEQLKLALADISYAGPLVFESFSANVDSAALAGSLALWRSLWDDPVVVARAARDFIAVHFDV